MQIVSVTSLAIPDIKVVRFRRFKDERGYFSETFRRAVIETHPDMGFLKDVEFLQSNESFSAKGVVRGLHFQWDKPMGKWVRTICGRMVDLMLDIRVGSPTFGKILAYEMPVQASSEFSEWIYLPPGFAHGNYFSENTFIEYFCTAGYNPACEAGISPFSKDMDWSMCDPKLTQEFETLKNHSPIVSPKDTGAPEFGQWVKSNQQKPVFIYRA